MNQVAVEKGDKTIVVAHAQHQGVKGLRGVGFEGNTNEDRGVFREHC